MWVGYVLRLLQDTVWKKVSSKAERECLQELCWASHYVWMCRA